MIEARNNSPDYGNWVSTKLLYVPGATGLFFMALSLVWPVLAVVAAAAVVCFVYFAYARYRFSSRGGNIQARIQGLVLEYLDWDGQGSAVDIGCGNGPLTVSLAQKYTQAKVIGLDYWGGAWEYSKGVCERNAWIEGVAERVAFQKASAAALPFADGTFGAAVSNLVFHEVRGVKDKKELIREALRVVKKGGSFAFQDLFLWKMIYGETDDLLETIRGWGIERVELVNTSRAEFIPRGLKLPFMVGTMGLLHGRK